MVESGKLTQRSEIINKCTEYTTDAICTCQCTNWQDDECSFSCTADMTRIQASLLHAEILQQWLPKQLPNEIPNDYDIAIEKWLANDVQDGLPSGIIELSLIDWVGSSAFSPVTKINSRSTSIKKGIRRSSIARSPTICFEQNYQEASTWQYQLPMTMEVFNGHARKIVDYSYVYMNEKVAHILTKALTKD